MWLLPASLGTGIHVSSIYTYRHTYTNTTRAHIPHKHTTHTCIHTSYINTYIHISCAQHTKHYPPHISTHQNNKETRWKQWCSSLNLTSSFHLFLHTHVHAHMHTNNTQTQHIHKCVWKSSRSYYKSESQQLIFSSPLTFGKIQLFDGEKALSLYQRCFQMYHTMTLRKWKKLTEDLC